MHLEMVLSGNLHPGRNLLFSLRLRFYLWLFSKFKLCVYIYFVRMHVYLCVCIHTQKNQFGFLKIYIYFKDFIYLLLERGGGREKEKHQGARDTSDRLPLTCPQLGTWPTTQACALTGNQTGDPLVCTPALNPLGYTSQGQFGFIYFTIYKN